MLRRSLDAVLCFFLLGLLVVFSLSVPSCSKKATEPEAEPPEEETTGVLATLHAAGDSVMLWSESMPYPDAAEKGAEWLRAQENVDSCGISVDHTIWIEFEGGIGGDIIPPREVFSESGDLKKARPLIMRNPAQPKVKSLAPAAVLCLPFDWEYNSGQYDSLTRILNSELCPFFVITQYPDAATSVALLKSVWSINGLFYFSTHGALSRSGLECLTGEKVTDELLSDYMADITLGRLRAGYIKGHEYFAITPAFVEHYWQPHPDTLAAHVVYVATCYSWEPKMTQAFLLCGADAYAGFTGLLWPEFEEELIPHLWEPMQDTFSLKWSYEHLPSNCEPPNDTFFIEYICEDIIFDRVLFTLDNVPVHSEQYLIRTPRHGGYTHFWMECLALRDSDLDVMGLLEIYADAYAEGTYEIAMDRDNVIYFVKEERLYHASKVGVDPVWDPDGVIEGEIVLTSLDNPPGLATGTFSGTLGWWDTENNPYPHPPDETLVITNGRFKVTVKE